MSTFYKDFEYVSDDSNGFSGLREVGRPDFDPGQGMTVAHDLLEHLTPRGGGAGEAEAFGAMLYIRVEGQYGSFNGWSMKPSDLARELLELIGRYDEGYCIEPDNDIRYCKDVEEEIEGFLETLHHADVSEDTDNPPSPETVKNIQAWVIHGYLLAQERYPSAYKAAELFYNAEHLADRFILEDRIDGDTVRFTVNPEDCTLEVQVITGYCHDTDQYMVDGEPDPDLYYEEEDCDED